MDSFFGIGVFELVFIIIFALIFLGPERLPGVLRQIIGVIRQVRDLTADVTRQFNDEFGDMADLDPRRQITKVLNETKSDIKEATKPVNKALNKPAAKTTPNTAAKPATTQKPTPKPTVTKPTVAKSTTDVAAAAESSVDTAEVTAAAAAKAASAAQNTGEVSDIALNVTADAVQETDSAAVDKVESSNDDFTENKIAPPNTARQTPPKDVSVSGSKPTGEPPAETPVDEATAEEKSL